MGRNEPCWCGSGKKYKHCHLDRDRERPVVPQELAQQFRRYFQVKTCLHPLAASEPCGRIIAAHTIQARGPIARILDDSGHCLTFYPARLLRDREPQKRGWREASTFYGFCQRHDGPTFVPLETQQFAGSPEQCFLLAYRAECHELYQKQASANSGELRHVVDRGKSPAVQRQLHRIQSTIQAGVEKGLAEARDNKTRMDAQLLARDFTGWNRLFVRFRGPMTVVSTGSMAPNRSLSGVELQALHDDSAEMQRLCIGVVRDEDGGAVVLSWRQEHEIVARFVNELRALPPKDLAATLVQFMFAYFENTYFSADWWESLSPDEREHVMSLAVMPNAYYEEWKYLQALRVPWDIYYSGDRWEPVSA